MDPAPCLPKLFPAPLLIALTYVYENHAYKQYLGPPLTLPSSSSGDHAPCIKNQEGGVDGFVQKYAAIMERWLTPPVSAVAVVPVVIGDVPPVAVLPPVVGIQIHG